MAQRDDKLTFVQARIAAVQDEALATKNAPGACPSHAVTVEAAVTSLQAAGLSLDLLAEQDRRLEKMDGDLGGVAGDLRTLVGRPAPKRIHVGSDGVDVEGYGARNVVGIATEYRVAELVNRTSDVP